MLQELKYKKKRNDFFIGSISIAAQMHKLGTI